MFQRTRRDLKQLREKTYDRSSLVIELFERIYAQHHCKEQGERIQHFKHTFTYLLVCALGAFVFQFHIQIYNALAGPFHLNHDQFVAHLQIYNQNLSSAQSRWFSLHKEYFQVEIGENYVERDHAHLLRVFDDEYTRTKILASLHRIKEPLITDSLRPNRLFVKFATVQQRHNHIRLSYHFQLFTIRTLRCIVRHLQVPPTEYGTWFEKSMYIRTIEEHYRENATFFNTIIVPSCGIPIGYLYRPKGELAYLPQSRFAYEFRQYDVAFDASYPYYPYVAFILGGIILVWLLLKSLFYFTIYLVHCVRRTTFFISPSVQSHLKELGVESLEKLNDLLFITSEENNYHHRLFLVRQQHLIMFNIDLNEHNPRILGQFYTQLPFIGVSVSSITKVVNDGFLVNNKGEQVWISFPTETRRMGDNEAEWLHERMMSISEQYRQCRDREQRLAREQARIREQKELEARRLDALICEEEQRQERNYENDLERMWERITSASPRYIANFRSTDHCSVKPDQTDLLALTCSVCLEKFQVGEIYACWPCPGRHVFHYGCMLDVLRAKNTCPLCRHPVEAAALLDRDIVFRLALQRLFSRITI